MKKLRTNEENKMAPKKKIKRRINKITEKKTNTFHSTYLHANDFIFKQQDFEF